MNLMRSRLDSWRPIVRHTRPCLAAALAVWGLASACLPATARSLNRASELFELGRYEEAIAEYKRTIALDPSWATPHLGLGNALSAVGDRPGALSAYERAVQLSPDWAEAHIALGGLLLETQRWADAERQLQAAVTTVSNDCRLHAMLGYALFKQRRQTEAIRAFERSRQLYEPCMTSEESSAYDALKSRVK